MERHDKQGAALELAARLLEQAEHSSEAEMRSSLSRMYYAVYHVARLVVGKTGHTAIAKALEGRESGIGKRYKALYELRQKADYHPDFVERRFGSLANFKLEFRNEMENARWLYEHLFKMEKI